MVGIGRVLMDGRDREGVGGWYGGGGCWWMVGIGRVLVDGRVGEGVVGWYGG